MVSVRAMYEPGPKRLRDGSGSFLACCTAAEPPAKNPIWRSLAYVP
jgi:hypothetical protein